MNRKFKNVTLLLCLMLITFILTSSAGCVYRGSPLVNLIIENKSDQVLTVILDNGLVGSVRPGDTITRKNLDIGFSKYVIEAKDNRGKIVFSRSYVFEEFQKVDDKVYKVVISQLDKALKSSNNVTDNVTLK